MCEYCGWQFGHHPRCPHYEARTTGEHCYFCGEPIIEGEDIYRSGDNVAHVHCFEETYQEDIAAFCGLNKEKGDYR